MSRKEKDFHSIKNMTAYELEQTAKLLCLDYIPGYNILNQCVWTFTRLPFITYNFMASQFYKLRLKRDKTLTPYIPLDFMAWKVSKFAFKFDSGPLSLVKKILLAN